MISDYMYKTNKDNKKGQVGKLAAIILILAGAIIMYMYLTQFMGKNTFTEAINICRLSVLGQVATETKLDMTISGAKSPFSISCEKRYVNFYNTKVELGLNPSNMKPLTVDVGGKKITKFKSLTDTVVDQVIAEEMRTCKYEFGDGKAEIFTNDEKLKDSIRVCFVCSEINFDKTVEKKAFDSLITYTNKTTFSDEGITYFNYLTETTVYDNTMWWQPTYKPESDKDAYYNNLTIDTSQPYVVVVSKWTIAPLDLWHWKNAINVQVIPAKYLNSWCALQAS
jgi:hypothetical protein